MKFKVFNMYEKTKVKLALQQTSDLKSGVQPAGEHCLSYIKSFRKMSGLTMRNLNYI